MTSHQVQLLFVDIALILFLARGLGYLAKRVGQPPVVGEILAGVLLGPTLLPAAVADTLFPSDVKALLTGMANVGVALFMFGVGLELDAAALRGRGRSTAGATLGSILVPFALGLGLAAYLARDYAPDHRAGFVVFFGLAVSVTAFPVLARILADRGMSSTAVGGLALATAAAVDVVAWAALASVQAVGGDGSGHWKVALALPFLGVMTVIVRPVLRRLLMRGGRPVALSGHLLVSVLALALLSAAATEAMGMHFIFGAFLCGAVMPRLGADTLREEIHRRTEQVTSLLLPVYFVVAGLKVDLSGIDGGALLDLGLILVVAVLGKFGGTYLGARTQGLQPRPAAALGVLMNTRGLTELVILGVGLQLGLLDDSLYSLMVVMAVVTTAMTGPLLSRVYGRPVELPPTPDRSRVRSQLPADRRKDYEDGEHEARAAAQ
ncbi:MULTISPECIES: cation:proton antiporter [unclassified Streptomyces]|uniref:cation:proton antiporter n=1 Tax=unclassified Streptomyces TaxID=2593676 RepID=UPI00278C2248|nr:MULTISPECIES: cation:proton antiporter [unclassified Streptomyces]